jgi:hypothetical protein
MKPTGSFQSCNTIHCHDIFRTFQTRHRPRPLVSWMAFLLSCWYTAPGCYRRAAYCRGRGLFPWLFMLDLWWTKWPSDKLLFTHFDLLLPMSLYLRSQVVPCTYGIYHYVAVEWSITGSGQLCQRVLAVKSTTDKHQQNSLGVPNGPRTLTKPKTGLQCVILETVTWRKHRYKLSGNRIKRRTYNSKEIEVL